MICPRLCAALWSGTSIYPELLIRMLVVGINKGRSIPGTDR